MTGIGGARDAPSIPAGGPTTTRPIDVTRYARFGLQQTAPDVRRRVGDDVVAARLAEELEADAAQDTRDGMAAYAAACPVRGASPDDYRLRELHGPRGEQLLTRIHFAGDEDRRRAFVDVTAQAGPIAPHALTDVVSALAREYAVFAPDAVRFWSPAPDAPRVHADARVDQWLVAGALDEVRARPRPASSERVTLEPDVDVSRYDEYVAAYDEVFADHPSLRGVVRVEARDALVDCARHGSFFVVRVDDAPAGFIAARPGGHRAVHGWVVVDELLARDFRGRGLAAAAQRALVDRLSAAHEGLLVGTIDGRNEPSLRTARRVGRRVVGA